MSLTTTNTGKLNRHRWRKPKFLERFKTLFESELTPGRGRSRSTHSKMPPCCRHQDELRTATALFLRIIGWSYYDSTTIFSALHSSRNKWDTCVLRQPLNSVHQYWIWNDVETKETRREEVLDWRTILLIIGKTMQTSRELNHRQEKRRFISPKGGNLLVTSRT